VQLLNLFTVIHKTRRFTIRVNNNPSLLSADPDNPSYLQQLPKSLQHYSTARV